MQQCAGCTFLGRLFIKDVTRAIQNGFCLSPLDFKFARLRLHQISNQSRGDTFRPGMLQRKLAEEVGFEPTVDLRPQQLSRLPRSTTLPLLLENTIDLLSVFSFRCLQVNFEEVYAALRHRNITSIDSGNRQSISSARGTGWSGISRGNTQTCRQSISSARGTGWSGISRGNTQT